MTSSPRTHTPVGRLIAQREAVDQLNALNGESQGAWVVDADIIDVDEHEMCANDWDHGLGIVRFPGMDGGCVGCSVRFLRGHLLAGDHISIDVGR